MSNICNFCSKEFSSKVNLIRHQTTVKKCLKLQGKEEENIKCENCLKILTIEYYKQHKIKCDLKMNKEKDHLEKQKLYKELQDKYKTLEIQNNKLKEEYNKLKIENNTLKIELSHTKIYKENINKLKIELAEAKTSINLLERQNERLHSSSTSITMKLAEKASTINNTNNTNTVIINTNQLTNEVLRQCANTFKIDHAQNINGIAKHLTTSLEDHITCTDPSRNIFKYTNEKDEEIIDQNLEILLPQYLTAVKDRNDFLYKEVFEYFKKNNVSLNVQTDYCIFYNALNSIIEKNGQQNKYSEKCKREMVKECKRRFLEKNKNKEKMITKKLTAEEVMMNIIETGGSLNDFVNKFFPNYINNEEEETDEDFTYRREMEDLFRQKKKEYKSRIENI
jgi:hypothetical protein